jgi:hypothetical protein
MWIICVLLLIKLNRQTGTHRNLTQPDCLFLTELTILYVMTHLIFHYTN